MTEVKGSGVRDLTLLSARLKVVEPKLRRQVRKALRDQADPLVRKVRQSVLEMRSEHDQDYSFREALAGTVYAQVSFLKSGIRVEILSAGRRMPPGMENLNMLTDRARGWGHPVYADSATPRGERTWVRQWGKPGWFEKPVIASHGEIKRALEDALDGVRRFVEG